MARNLACQTGKNSSMCVRMRTDAWRCGSGEVVCAMSWRKFWNFQKFISKVSRLVTTRLLSAHAWHWVPRISWTVRNLCVTDGMTWRKLPTFPSWQPLKWHDLARHTSGHCGNKIRASVRLALLRNNFTLDRLARIRLDHAVTWPPSIEND